MEKISDLRYDQHLSREDLVSVTRRLDDKRNSETNKAVEDTKRKIRAAFSGAERVKASLRP